MTVPFGKMRWMASSDPQAFKAASCNEPHGSSQGLGQLPRVSPCCKCAATDAESTQIDRRLMLDASWHMVVFGGEQSRNAGESVEGVPTATAMNIMITTTVVVIVIVVVIVAN